MSGTATITPIPILSLPDPKTVGEGLLDPLGLARLADQLADRILPGMTARMNRPRFLTCMAVSAVVCEGMEDEISTDGVSPAYLVFEWLMVEGFARESERSAVRGTPGIDKAHTARQQGTPLSARSYLKTPTVFGFHGVYKRLARYLGIVDGNLCLAENGYALLKTWEREQGLSGFVEAATSGSFSGVRSLLRDAVRDGLKFGYTQRSSGWQGWSLLAKHLAPAGMGRQEAEFFRHLLCSQGSEPRSNEIFRILSSADSLHRAESSDTEADAYERAVASDASTELHLRFSAVDAYERFCALIEEAFDWLRYLSSIRDARPLSASDYENTERIRAITARVRGQLELAEKAISEASADSFKDFVAFAKYFDHVRSGAELYGALLARHAGVQKAKPPDGKREWFEHGPDGSIFVRPPYRLTEVPSKPNGWGRPYRLANARSFSSDLSKAIS